VTYFFVACSAFTVVANAVESSFAIGAGGGASSRSFPEVDHRIQSLCVAEILVRMRDVNPELSR
jgi:hypothetical protein